MNCFSYHLIFQFEIGLSDLSLQYIIRLLISLALCLLPRNVVGIKIIMSINLVIKKNLLVKKSESVGDPLKKVELLGLLESARSLLRSLRKGGHK